MKLTVGFKNIDVLIINEQTKLKLRISVYKLIQIELLSDTDTRSLDTQKVVSGCLCFT